MAAASTCSRRSSALGRRPAFFVMPLLLISQSELVKRPIPSPRHLTGRTVRQVVRAGVDGDEMRLRWSNQFGRTPLRLTATVAGHTTRVVVPTRAEIIGEPLPIRVGAGADID